MSWLIYKHTNLANGKVYIGQTCKKPEYRWNNGKGYTRTDTHFARAILLYGWNNFSHEIIECDIETQEKADEREIYWIKFYDSFFNGYNDTFGGNSHDHEGKSIYQINKEDLSIIKEFVSISEAHRITGYNASGIGSCCRRERTEANGFYWCFKSDYLTFKPREYEGNYVPVLMLDKEDYHIIKRYKSLKEAALELGTNHGNIMRVCQRKNTNSNGYTWCYEKDYYPGWIPKKLEHGEHGHKKVICFETKEIYKSESEAARKNNTSTGNIYLCLTNKQKTIRNKHFIWLDEYDESYLPPIKFDNKRKVYCFENGKIYNSVSECSIELDINPSQIIGVCSGKELTAKRMHFCYLEDKDDYVLRKGKQRKILCIETNVVYSSNKEATELTGIKHINECCRHQVVTAGGYHWCYEDEKDTYVPNENKAKKRVLCIETNEVFEKIKDACFKYSIKPSCITACCKGYQKTAGGYHWKYVEK